MAIAPITLTFPTLASLYGAYREFPIMKNLKHAARASSVLVTAYLIHEKVLTPEEATANEEDDDIQLRGDIDIRFMQLLSILEASETQPLNKVHIDPILRVLSHSIPQSQIPGFNRKTFTRSSDLPNFSQLFKYLRENYRKKYKHYLNKKLESKISQVYRLRNPSLLHSNNAQAWIKGYIDIEEPHGTLYHFVLDYFEEYYSTSRRFTFLKSLDSPDIYCEQAKLFRWIIKDKQFLRHYTPLHIQTVECSFMRMQSS